MTAAIFAAREGAQVVLLEHKDRVGKKILSTGNGRCNLSNRLQEPFCYRSGQPDFPWKALGAFTLPMTLEYFEDLGVLTRERDGYLYPYSGQASAVLDALRLGLARESVQVVTECEVFSITPREDAKHRFEVKTSQGSFSGETLILACGSKAARFSQPFLSFTPVSIQCRLHPFFLPLPIFTPKPLIQLHQRLY